MTSFKGKHTEKRPLEMPKQRLEDTDRMDLKKNKCRYEKLDDSTQNRDYWRTLVNMALNLQAP